MLKTTQSRPTTGLPWVVFLLEFLILHRDAAERLHDSVSGSRKAVLTEKENLSAVTASPL